MSATVLWIIVLAGGWLIGMTLLVALLTASKRGDRQVYRMHVLRSLDPSLSPEQRQAHARIAEALRHHVS